MIYGNPNAKSESNGNAVFEMFNVQGIVGFWHMDEPQWTGATGEVRDETGMNHGTAKNGATTTSDAKYGRAGLFDGSDGYVEVPDSDSLDVSSEVTIEAWALTKGILSTNDHILRKDDAYGMWVEDTLRPWGRVWMSNGAGANLPRNKTITTNEWHHLVITADSNELKVKMYIDGDFNSQVDYDGTIQESTVKLFIASYKGGESYWNGTIDEVRIWERALTPTEVQILSKNYMQKMGSYFNVRKYVTPAPVVIV